MDHKEGVSFVLLVVRTAYLSGSIPLGRPWLAMEVCSSNPHLNWSRSWRLEAAVLCSALTKEYLINYARPLIYSTSLSFPSLAAIRVVYSLMAKGVTQPVSRKLPQSWLKRHLLPLLKLVLRLDSLIDALYCQLKTLIPLLEDESSKEQLLKIPKNNPRSPIFALVTPYPRSLAEHCQEAGFVVRPVFPPTVPEGTQRVRVCLHAGNSFKDVETLVMRIANWLQCLKSSEADVYKLDIVKAML